MIGKSKPTTETRRHGGSPTSRVIAGIAGIGKGKTLPQIDADRPLRKESDVARRIVWNPILNRRSGKGGYLRNLQNSTGYSLIPVTMQPRYSEIPDAIAELVRINPVPTMLIDMTTFRVAVVNAAAFGFLGYTEAEMVGQSITNFVPLDDIAAVEHSADEPPPEGETQWRCVTKDGRILFVKLKYRETMYQGRPARFVVLIESSSTPFA